jgi:hypothetical protein
MRNAAQTVTPPLHNKAPVISTSALVNVLLSKNMVEKGSSMDKMDGGRVGGMIVHAKI